MCEPDATAADAAAATTLTFSTEKRAAAVPSLKSDSPSPMTRKRWGTPSERKIDGTLMGSVGDFPPMSNRGEATVVISRSRRSEPRDDSATALQSARAPAEISSAMAAMSGAGGRSAFSFGTRERISLWAASTDLLDLSGR